MIGAFGAPPLLASLHETSKLAFYIAGGALAAWAFAVSFVGFRRGSFPGSESGARAIMAVSVLLVLAATSTAAITASTPAGVPAFTRPLLGPKGTATPPTAASSTAAAAPSTAAPAASPGTVDITADSTGQLHYTQPSATATAKGGKVTINFHNQAQLGHNLTLARGSTVLGATPTFAGGTQTLKLALTPGTYAYYCTVPGHRQAGMQGTLTVS